MMLRGWGFQVGGDIASVLVSFDRAGLRLKTVLQLGLSGRGQWQPGSELEEQ